MSTIGGIGSWQYQPYTPPTFSQLDTNSDGGISLDEFEAGGPQGSSSDSDATSAAQQKRAEALFNQIDTNGDGSVSSDELSAFQSKIADQRQSQAFATQLLANGQQPPSDTDVFNATDKNGDGSVSLSEFSQSDAAKGLSSDQLSQIFNTIDSNGDGSISQSEASTFLDNLKSETASAGAPSGPPPGGSAGGVHHGGGHHHHASGISGTDTTGTTSTDTSDGNSLLATLEGILNGTSAAGTGADSGSTDTSDSSSSPLDLLTAATNAYSSGSQSTDLWSSISNLLEAA